MYNAIRISAALIWLWFVMTISPAGAKGAEPAAALQLPATQAAEHVTYQVPQVTAPTLDDLVGRMDWGFAVNVLSPADFRQLREYPPSPMLRLGWDQTGLLVLAKVADTTPSESDSDNTLSAHDSVELFVARADDPTQRYRVIVAPGRTTAFPSPRVFYSDQRKQGDPEKLQAEVARKLSEDGYALLVRLPWQNLRMTPAAGAEVLLQVHVNDANAAEKRLQSVWYPGTDAWRSAKATYRLRLAKEASEPVNLAAIGQYQQFRHTQLVVRAVPDLAGTPVEIFENGRLLASGVLQTEGQSTMASIRLPMPREDHPYAPLTVVAQKLPASPLMLQLPELPDIQSAVEQADFGFENCIFSGKRFPACDFRDPLSAEDMLGSYTLTTTFYDAHFNVVTEPKEPGRYGAVCQIRAATGKVYKRYYSLYRTAEKFSWRASDFNATAQLPKELGIDPRVAWRENGAIAGQMIKDVRSAAGRSDAWAVVLAGLGQSTPDAPKMTGRDEPWAQAQQWWAQLRCKTEDYKYPYLVTTPRDYRADGAEQYPLILFLHGSGERGRDQSKMPENQVSAFLEDHPEFRFVVVAPQCPPNEWWCPYVLDRLLNEVQGRYAIDPDRVYVTGLSMGGFGTWAMISMYPERFAAAAPICGAGDKDDMQRIRNVPVWAFHGDKDETVSFDWDAAGIDALRKAGGRVRFTVYPGVGHDSWTQTYRNPELYQWLLQQKRLEPAEQHVAAQ